MLIVSFLGIFEGVGVISKGKILNLFHNQKLLPRIPLCLLELSYLKASICFLDGSVMEKSCIFCILMKSPDLLFPIASWCIFTSFVL